MLLSNLVSGSTSVVSCTGLRVMYCIVSVGRMWLETKMNILAIIILWEVVWGRGGAGDFHLVLCT